MTVGSMDTTSSAHGTTISPHDFDHPYYAFKRAALQRATQGRHGFQHTHEQALASQRMARRQRRRQRHNDSGSRRLANRQRRAQGMRDEQSRLSFDEQFRQFDRGRRKFLRGATPTAGDIIGHVHKEHRRKTRKHKRRDELRVNALEIAAIEQGARTAIRKEVEEIKGSGQYGHVSKTKPDDTVRVMIENFNILRVFATGRASRKKIRRLKRLHKEYDIDLLAGCETQCDWRFADDHQKFANLFGQGQERRSVVGYNTTEEKIARRQHGGTAMMAFGRLSAQVLASDVNETGLGRWC